MMDYLDVGTSSESDNDGDGMCELDDSDEEERRENKSLLKMLNLHDPPTKNQRNIQDFEAEMEAELDRRALEIEVKGGMEHQRSLSRSSSNTSLNRSPRASPIPGSSSSDAQSLTKKSNLKRIKSTSSESINSEVKAKSVKFTLSKDVNTTLMSQSNHISGEGKLTQLTSNEAGKLYDELYFDSDESDDESKNISETRRFRTDEELFYDPTADAKDQAWIDKKRRMAYGESKSKTSQKNKHTTAKAALQVPASVTPSTAPLPTTDAVLNCPACFTTVCHDCQRHELYAGQYRAMFVNNCTVNMQETLRIPTKKNSKSRRNKKGTDSKSNEFINNSDSDVFYPVMCKVCKTQVAMYDNEEVYHFFNVLASQP